MPEPVKKKGGWFVETPDGASGPWNTKEAAEAAANEDWFKANLLHNKAKKDD